MQALYNRIIFAGIIFLLIVVSVIMYHNLNQYMREVKMVRHSSEVIFELNNLLSLIKDREIGYRGYQLTGDTTFLRPYFWSLDQVESRWRVLDSLITDAEGSSQKDTLKMLVAKQNSLIERLFAQQREFDSSYPNKEELDLLIADRNNMADIRGVIRGMTSKESLLLKRRLEEESDFRALTPLSLLAYVLFALGGATFLFIRVNESLERRRKVERQLQGNLIALKNEVGIREFAERSLRSVLESSLNGILVFRSIRNPDGEVIDFKCLLSNSIGARISGKSSGMLTDEKFLAIFPAPRHAPLFQICVKAVNTESPQQFEYLFTGPEWNQWFFITAVKLDDGVVVTFSDVTEQKEQMLQMEEHEFLLKEAESMVSMGSWSYDLVSHKMVWSGGLFDIMRQSPENFSPAWDSLLDFVHDEDRQALGTRLVEVLNNWNDFSIDFRIVLAGGIRFLKMKGRPRVDVAGNYAGYIGTMEDVTEERLAALNLNRRAEDLRRSNEDLEQFAYVASHDLQEPLRKIRAFGNRLEENFKDQLPNMGRDYLARMQKSAARMQTLIQDLLDFSRVTQEKHLSPIDLNKVLESTLDTLLPEIEEQEAHVSITSSLPTIDGNEAQLSRLFQNLISNALKFRHKDRSPMIEVTARQITGSSVPAQFDTRVPDGLYTMITVKDNGIGFDQKYSEKIFDLFQRLHGRTAYEGTGMGLSICRKIVHNHGGFITVSSAENVGSEFKIILPVSKTTLAYQNFQTTTA